MSSEIPLEAPLPGSTTISDQFTESPWARWSDWAGMVASIGCAIHCAAMPFVIAYLPALGLSFLADEAFHKWMAASCIAIALAAFVPGIQKHGRLTPVIVGSVGLVMISTAAFGFVGDCCAACEVDAASVGLAFSGGPEDGSSDSASESCADECCPHCASGGSDTDSEAESLVSLAGESPLATSSASSQLTARIAPWLTPIGGIILVSAHLLNRRFGCLCGCCDNESAAGVA